MINVYRLKRQHTEIAKAMIEAMTAIDAGEVPSHAPSIRTLLDEMSGLIRSHLKIEDAEIYPVLVDSVRSDVSRTARQFSDTMGGLAQEFQDYLERYRSPGRIEAQVPLFCYETRRIFERLRYRMQREETDLYPLLTVETEAQAAVH